MESKPIKIMEVKEYLIGRELTQLECKEPLKILRPGDKGDLKLRCSNVWAGNISNIPRRLCVSLDVNWGYNGTGPFDLALNVLFHYSGGDEAFTYHYARLFVKEFIGFLPKDTPLVVYSEAIVRWVNDKKALPATYSGARPAVVDICPGHLAWDNEGEKILSPGQVD